MELILKNTDILDQEVSKKLEELIISEKTVIDGNKYYNLTVNFNEEFLKSDKCKDYCFSKIPKNLNHKEWDKMIQDCIYDLLKNFLQVIKNTMNKSSNLKESMLCFTKIRSDKLEAINMLKIEVEETEPHISGKGKTKRVARCESVMPSSSFVSDKLRKHASEKFYEIFRELYELLGYQHMSEVLRIEENSNINQLYHVFVEQYIDLFNESYLSG